MHAVLSGVDLQRQTLRLYGELAARRDTWAGQLVFGYGAGVTTTGLPTAVSIAGGTSLLLEADAAVLRSVFRQGGVDFVVNTIDEALRTLKNEIRKQRPLSVAVEGDVPAMVAEMRARGVLPDLQVSIERKGGHEQRLGIEHLQLTGEYSSLVPSARLEAWLKERGWCEVIFHRATTAEMRILDAELLNVLPERDAQRRHWVQRIGRYQRIVANGARVVWLTKTECARFKGYVLEDQLRP